MPTAVLDETDFAIDNGLPPLDEIEEDMPRKSPDTFWQKYGNLAQWVGAAIAVLGGVGLPLYFHSTATTASITDEHIDLRIENKLGPAIAVVNQHTDAKTDEIGKKVDVLAEKVSNLYGLDGKVAQLETHLGHQDSLARLMDPSRTLATVRAEIGLAEAHNQILPASTLVDYRNAALELPSTAYQYWTTVAVIINYQSKLDQMAGEAPDPQKVAKSCMWGTRVPGISFKDSKLAYETLSNCVVDLDHEGLTFDHVIFRNSVIRYSGGPTNLIAVHFVNCNFQVNINQQTKPDVPKFLLAVLSSPNQKSVVVP